MMKIVASLLVLGLCAHVCLGNAVAPVSTSQSSFASSSLNGTLYKVYSAGNTTDATNWDSSSTTATTAAGVDSEYVIFGPGSSNTTAYVYGAVWSTTAGKTSQWASIVKRTINTTIAANGSDTTEAAIQSADNVVSVSNIDTTNAVGWAVGPGVLGVISAISDGTNNQVYFSTLIGTTWSSNALTKTLDITGSTQTSSIFCTTTSFGIGDVWYEQGSAAFFYTYWKKVITDGAGSGTTCGTAASTAYTIYVGGWYANGTVAYFAPIALTPNKATNAISSLMSGPDNWLNATNIVVVYQDANAAGTGTGTGVSYSSKTTKATTTTSGGSFSALATNANSGTGSTLVAMTYLPIGVWASNYTYGIAVSNFTSTGSTPTNTYTITNFLNGSSTGTDSGLSYSSATSSATGLFGWALTTGYTLVGVWPSATAGSYYALGTFYGNGTVNSTAASLGSVEGAVSFFEDINGTAWVGWQDVDTKNDVNSVDAITYAGYLAKLQGQLNVASSNANILAALSGVALFFAAIFAF